MCGLFAAFGYGDGARTLDQAAVVATRDAMVHRGPDASGLWMQDDATVVLAHRRLSIIDLSVQGTQPLCSVDGRFRIVFNGEIYNYRDLKQTLEATGCRFKTETDTEVIVEVYRTWGAEGLKRLRGMFAFALWDGVRQGLLLARDGFGIKPLYVYDTGKQIAVASEFRALRRWAGKDVSADFDAQMAFFLRGCLPAHRTPVREIRLLPEGTWLWCDRSGQTRGQFFDPVALAMSAEAGARRTWSERQRQTTLRDALADSVTQHLVADVPIGIFLSAGVDSTLVSSLVAAERPNGLKAVTLGVPSFRNTANDEVVPAQELARRFGFEHAVSWLDKAAFMAEAGAVIGAMDVPTIDGVNTYFVAQATRAAGLKVALSGLGGDELFSGYPSAQEVPRLARLMRPFVAMPGVARALRRAVAPFVSRMTSPKYASLAEYGGRFSGAFFLRRAVYMPWELEQALGRDRVATAMSELAPDYGFDGRYDAIQAPHLRVALMEMQLYMRDQLLRDSDWAGMAHGLEIRVPLVDTVLFERLLPLLIADAPVSKSDVGQATNADVLAAAQRPKTGFSLPVGTWLAEHYGLKQRRLRDWAIVAFEQWCRLNDVPNAVAAFTQQSSLPKALAVSARQH